MKDEECRKAAAFFILHPTFFIQVDSASTLVADFFCRRIGCNAQGSKEASIVRADLERAPSMTGARRRSNLGERTRSGTADEPDDRFQ